jgi:hypothetical protein
MWYRGEYAEHYCNIDVKKYVKLFLAGPIMYIPQKNAINHYHTEKNSNSL